ncbi:1-acyl-sn-glycerol-3-phosphate acyltransferase [Actinospica sp.]|uniref:1-acyl-sn-glycerol-3-phosphate acyltransferase n=1 Tax=Actinospica sp. TaxID=1872142 RepID=UPI002BCC3FAE|nr:1-acyl-sn-glycerol-3-phosphate acyltransferase [Actinospica sp.]HWG23679.1 1-acyl-sn-glycerol-3-phosphate acyltransferase [Actinospica sp.]
MTSTIRFLVRHTALRRLMGLCLLGVFLLAGLVVLPVAFLLGVLLSLRPGGRGRSARFAAFTTVYLAAEIAGLWQVLRLRGPLARADVAGDPARLLDEHYLLLQRLLGRLHSAAERWFGLRLTPPDRGHDVPDGPLIVASRHAGPGDSFLLVYALMVVAGRRPRVVLSRALALDPLIDALLSHTPNCFVGFESDQRQRSTDEIAGLARTLGPRDAVVIFPEGRNFTVLRRARLIERLRRRRRDARRLLPSARALEHVLPARGCGLFAAVDAAPPGTHLVFVAHTGLDAIESARDAWRAVPLERPVELDWWSSRVDEVPTDAADRERWLEAQWLRVDAWIDDHGAQSEAGPDSAVVDANQNRAIPT